MKRILLSIALTVALVTGLNAQTPVDKWGQLQVNGTQLCDKNGEPVVLRGVSFGWHNLWPRFYNEGAVRTLARYWNASVVRAAIGIQIEDNYLENPEYAEKCLTRVVNAAIKNGVYVIVDWHAHTMHTEEAKAFFGKVAKKWGKYPNVIYELYNEPIDDSWESLKEYAQTIIKEIRTYDPDNVILVGCPHWDQDINLPAADPIVGEKNIMYTLHFYAATHKDYLRDRMEEAIGAGLPVFVSECGGMDASGDGNLSPEEYQKWIDVMERNKVSWVNWSLSDKNEVCSMLLPRAASTGNWTPDLIKPWGKLVKESLEKYNK